MSEPDNQEREQLVDPPDIPELSEGDGFKIKDWITVGLSSLALAVSAASLYIGTLRVEESAQARIADVDLAPGTPTDNSEGYRHGFAVAHFAFVNTGNRAAVVLETSYIANNRSDSIAGGFGDHVSTTAEVFPLLLSPHEIKVVNLRIPIGLLIQNYKNGAQSDNPNSTAENPYKTFFCGFTFKTLDSRGTVHDAWSDSQLRVDVSKTALGSFGALKYGRDNAPLYPLTQLLSP